MNDIFHTVSFIDRKKEVNMVGHDDEAIQDITFVIEMEKCIDQNLSD